MASSELYKRIITDISSEFPDFQIIKKEDSTLMKAIDVALKIITFGQMKIFMTNFVTTVGNKIYVPSNWEEYPLISRSVILRHERIHMRQAKKYGRFLFSMLYLIVPFPLFFAYFRKKFEQEAYEESLRAIYELNGSRALDSTELKERILSHFTTASYFWMWPWRASLNKWYDNAVVRIKSKK